MVMGLLSPRGSQITTTPVAESCPSYLKGVSKDILKKCDGLPLAINAISSLLATRKTKEEWDEVRCSIDFARGTNPDIDALNYILSLSYFDLPHRLRSCLLYMTLFPEDYKIDRLRLVHRWISEGFVHSKDGKDLVELGDAYFHELVNRSLIQPIDIGYDGKAWGCRVHDTILDFLIYKSTQENFCTLLGDRSEATNFSDNEVRRLSQLGNVGRSHKMDLSHARTFGTFVHTKQMLSLESNALRVLDLEDCCGLENHHIKSIGRFPQLRYLNISSTRITKLPEQIGDLRHLETLNAYCDLLRELSETVTRLQRLVRLSIRWRTKLPDSIGNMTNLQELQYIDVFKHSLCFVDLRKLRIKLDTDGIEGEKLASYKEKLESSLRKLDARKCPSLWIAVCLSEKDGVEGYPFFPALSCIRKISLVCRERCRIAKCLIQLVSLEKLYVYAKEIEKQDLEIVGRIPNLLEVDIYNGKTGHRHHQRRISTAAVFSVHCNTCKGLMFEAGTMPKLPCLTRTRV
ncbi:disease resistance protein Pik-2-like [Aegilops tauschii subsp. strangulata]|uniref:Disease resistance protein RPM1 n=1 Tax=Aegilops tauschii TaxID=37682 RepID=M8C271_AEGTA